MIHRAELARSKKPLRRTARLNPGTKGLKRSPFTVNPVRRYTVSRTKNAPRDNEPTPETVRLVVNRDGHRCVVCGRPNRGERGVHWSIHHRRPKGIGGSRLPDTHEPQNLIDVCGRDNSTGCHGRIHRNEGNESRFYGWLLSNTRAQRDPLLVPVFVASEGGSRWMRLDADGERHDVEAVAA